MKHVLFCVCTSAVLMFSFSRADDEAAKPTVEADEPELQYESEGIKIAAAVHDEAYTELSLNQAAEYLEQGAVAWSREQQCISCHTNGTYLFIRPSLTPTLGPPSEEIRHFFLEQLQSLRETELPVLSEGTRPAQLIYLAAGLAQWDAHVSHRLSTDTASALQLMFEIQNDDGTWHAMECWPPFESSVYQEATMAAMAVAAAPNWLSSVTDESTLAHVERLRTYLQNTQPPHDYARVLKLWTSIHFDGILPEDEREQTVSMILKKQRADGGWNIRDFAQPNEWGNGNRAEKLLTEVNPDPAASDGHMTGLALLVLQQADATDSADAVRQGVGWLKSHQRESGRWWTRSLNTDEWHFITFSGTAYPMLALQLFDSR